MSTENVHDMTDDIRWSTICHRVDELCAKERMANLERINVGAYLIANVVRNMPQEEQFRWFAYVIHEVCAKSAGLDLQPIVEADFVNRSRRKR